MSSVEGATGAPSPRWSAGPVSLAMYPFAHLQEAYQALWDDVVAELGDDRWPCRLTWADDVAALWADDRLVVAQTCAWPLVTRLADRVQVVGSFVHRLPAFTAGTPLDTGLDRAADADEGASYRSVLVAARAGELASFAGEPVAVNNPDSLSGWISLRSVLPDHGPVTWTGSHRDSVRAVLAGWVSVASIDAVSLVHIADSEPGVGAGLRVVGRGPRVPTLPIIAGRRMPRAELAALRHALVTCARRSPAALYIDGFEPLDLAAYGRVSALDEELFARQRPGESSA